MVLDYLTQGTPLYVSPEQSLYALKVAQGARQSAETGKTVVFE
jgi:biliverdin reductase